MYLAGYIERMGTGDIIRLCKEKGLKAPEFIQEEEFRTIIWRTPIKPAIGSKTLQATLQATGQVSGQVGGQATGQAAESIMRIIWVIEGEMRSADIQQALQLKHREYFRDNYLLPAIEDGYVELKFPNSPKHPNQQYRLTQTGIALKKQLQKIKKKK